MKAMIVLLAAAIAWAGQIQPFAGISMGFGSSVWENKMYDPHGRFGVRYVTDHVEIEASHLSAIPNPFDAWGVNMIGASVVTKKWSNVSAFAGYYRNLTHSGGYVADFNGDLYRAGIRYDRGDQRLFADGICTDRQCLGSFGIEWIF